MAWNGFPATYQPLGYQPYPQMFQQQPAAPAAPQPPPQPASRMVEVFPADSVADAEKFPVNPGTTCVLFSRDDSFIAVKTVGVNGKATLCVYDRRPPEPDAPAFDPKEYVRRDEVETLISAALSAHLRKKEAE